MGHRRIHVDPYAGLTTICRIRHVIVLPGTAVAATSGAVQRPVAHASVTSPSSRCAPQPIKAGRFTRAGVHSNRVSPINTAGIVPNRPQPPSRSTRSTHVRTKCSHRNVSSREFDPHFRYNRRTGVRSERYPMPAFELVSDFHRRRSPSAIAQLVDGLELRRKGIVGATRNRQDVHVAQVIRNQATLIWRITRRWPHSSTRSSRSSSRATPSNTTSATMITISRNPTSRATTSTSRNRPTSTSRSSACVSPLKLPFSRAGT